VGDVGLKKIKDHFKKSSADKLNAMKMHMKLKFLYTAPWEFTALCIKEGDLVQLARGKEVDERLSRGFYPRGKPLPEREVGRLHPDQDHLFTSPEKREEEGKWKPMGGTEHLVRPRLGEAAKTPRREAHVRCVHHHQQVRGKPPDVSNDIFWSLAALHHGPIGPE
jgi:hypothetical protein